MKKLSIILLTLLFHFPLLAQGNLAFRSYRPSILVPPQSRLLSLYFNVESRLTFTNSLIKPSWIDMNLISSYEVSPFPKEKSINIGVQGILGSYGFTLHGTGKWIPFPDYNLQPAIGILADIYGGLSSDTEFIAGSNLQFLIKKSFPISLSKSIEDWGAYFAPSIHFDLLEIKNFLIHWIIGLNFNFEQTRLISRKWSLNLEGNYNTKFYQIGAQFLLYIQ